MARAANFEKLTPMFALRRPVTTTLEVPSADGAAIQPGRYTKSAKRSRPAPISRPAPGTLYAGDLGRVDSDGSDVVERDRDIVKNECIRVSVRAVEGGIEELPGVVAPAVVGAPLLPLVGSIEESLRCG